MREGGSEIVGKDIGAGKCTEHTYGQDEKDSSTFAWVCDYLLEKWGFKILLEVHCFAVVSGKIDPFPKAWKYWRRDERLKECILVTVNAKKQLGESEKQSQSSVLL